MTVTPHCASVSGSLAMETELFASVEAGDLDKFRELIKKETKETIDQVDFYGYTALHAAAENGRLEMIQPLLGQKNMSHKNIWNNFFFRCRG